MEHVIDACRVIAKVLLKTVFCDASPPNLGLGVLPARQLVSHVENILCSQMLNSLPSEVPEPIFFLVIAQNIVHFHGVSQLPRLLGRRPIGFGGENIRVDT